MISFYVSSSFIKRAVALGQLVLFIFILSCNDKPKEVNGFTISSITPAEGPIEGGTTISIEGENLQYVQTVKIDGVNCSNLTVVDESTITCRTPVHAEGEATVVVSNTVDGSASGSFRYIYHPLTVTSFTPTAGPDTGGVQFTVRGKGFAPGTTVTIGGQPCTPVTIDSTTSLRCTTPVLSAGSYDVVVTDTEGETVTPVQEYTSSLSPTVTGIAPAFGSALGGTVVTITGTNFVRPVVNIGAVPCNISSRTSTSITCTTSAKPAGVVNVRVQNFDGNGVTLTKAYTYIQNPTPLSVSPSFGVPTGGTTITINGDHFQSGATVTIDGVACGAVTFVSRTQLTCVTPVGTVGFKTLRVTNPDTYFGNLANGFEYRELPPDLVSIAPTGGPTSGGTTITLTGTSFQVGATATIGGLACTSPNVTASTTMTCVSPTHFQGAKDVVIRNPDTQTDTLAGAFTYQAPPTVTSVAPEFGPLAGGGTLTITGTNFRAGVSVSVGGAACPVTGTPTLTEVQCTIPAHAAGAVAVVVSNTDSQTASGAYTYTGAPTITSLSPNAGNIAGGTTVVFTGTNFFPGAVASIDGQACGSTTFVSSTRIDCLSPSTSSGGPFPYTVGVSVLNTDTQTGSLAASFSYRPPPAITSATPSGGSTSGGTSITITGTNFIAGATVLIGTVNCPVSAEAPPTSITCTVPAQTAGVRNLTVTNPDTQSATLTNGYTYLAPPTVTAVSPDSGALAGGTVLTITGTNFFDGATVDVGGSACTSVFVTSSTSITCTTPAHAAGTVTITITNIDTQTAAIANSYTYRAAPAIAGVSPVAGALAGGTAITITGTDFVSGMSVDFGGSPCTVTSSNATTINCTTTAHAAGVVAVVVTNPDAQASNADSYTFQPAPTVTAASPIGANSAGGDVITLTGTGFVAGATVTIGGVACPVVTLAATSITCTSGAHAAGVVGVVVTNADTQSGSLASALMYLDAPVVASVSPTAGPLAGGSTLTITGTGFFSGASVDVGGNDCPVLTQTETQITCTLAAHAAGSEAVTVTNVDAQNSSLPAAYTYRPAPTVTSVAFNAGPLGGGTAVTVNGTGFVTGATVNFDTSACVITASTATTINCITPAHSAGSVTVTVTNADSQSGSLGSAFTYQAAPTISTVTPAIGSAAGGTSVVITGTGFSSTPSVSIGSVNCSVTAESSTSITCTTTARAAGTVDVVVTNTDSQTATKTNSFTYLDAPTVTSVTPVAGALAGGSTVTIAGTNFYAGATVSLGGSACTLLTISSTSLTCRTTAHAAGSVTAVVTNVDTQSGNLPGAFEYRAAPTVTSVSPSFGPIGGGTTLTITGTGFVTGASVTVGSSACTVSALAATSITCATTLSLVSGSVSVTVENPDDLQRGTRATSFIYLNPPTVTAVSPSAGPLAGGTTITVSGTAFFPGATVTVGGAACTSVSVVSDTSITCVTPAAGAGAATVTVTNPDSQSGSRANGFTYQVPPAMTSVSPASGRLAGGTSITITGTDFVAGASVRVGGSICTSVVVTPTSITCNTPPGLAGSVNVQVTNADGQSDTLVGVYTYQSAPTVTSVSPSGGPLAGGTTITITGTNFLAGATVSIGGTACGTVNIVSVTSITCVTPAKTAGAYTLTVTNVDNQVGSRVNGFTYQGAPTVTNISPSVGASAGNTLVTISGTNFLSGATVTIGGTACGTVTVVSATSLTCRTGAHAAGSGVIDVTNPDTQAGSGSSYLYQDAPAVTSVTPATSAVAGGQAITITGTGFLTGATVRIGGTSCGSVVVASSTSITCTTGAKSAGTYDLTVTNTDTQVGTLTGGFTYQGAPAITSVSPALGDVGGGQVVTITGTSFITGATVMIGTTSCAVSSVSATSITCTTGASLAGLYNVTVTNPDTQAGTRTSSFRYIDAPIVTSISPTSGTIAGGTTVTITGTNFYAGSAVSIGGSACTSVSVVSTTSITCVTPAHAAGAADVDVVSAFGTTGNLVGAYTFTATPASIGFVVGTSSPTPPNPDNYGTTTTNITHTFTVRNNGASASSNLTMSLGGANPAAWVIQTDTCTGFPLAAGGTCTVQVTFIGAFLSAGSYSATVVATATTGGTVTNAIQGTRP